MRTNGSVMHCSILDLLTKCIPTGLKNHFHHLFFFLYSEWVLGTREDLVKDIIAELRPDLGEVITDSVFLFSFICAIFLLHFLYKFTARRMILTLS